MVTRSWGQGRNTRKACKLESGWGDFPWGVVTLTHVKGTFFQHWVLMKDGWGKRGDC